MPRLSFLKWIGISKNSKIAFSHCFCSLPPSFLYCPYSCPVPAEYFTQKHLLREGFSDTPHTPNAYLLLHCFILPDCSYHHLLYILFT